AQHLIRTGRFTAYARLGAFTRSASRFGLHAGCRLRRVAGAWTRYGPGRWRGASLYLAVAATRLAARRIRRQSTHPQSAMPQLRRLSGLYVITDAALVGGAQLVPAVKAALQGGARLVQYRDKSQDAARRRQEAEALCRLCHAHNALLIINDDVQLAADCGADGVHLGKDDAGIQAARARPGPNAVIGVSCYNDLARAHEAKTAGADYLAFGSFYPSTIKP